MNPSREVKCIKLPGARHWSTRIAPKNRVYDPNGLSPTLDTDPRLYVLLYEKIGRSTNET